MQSPVLSREEELYWLALRLVPGLGARTSGKLLDRFRTPQAIFRASRTELEAAGVSGSVAQSIASGTAFEDAVTQQEKMAETGTVAVTLSDPRYPQRLREIFDPPIVLFARGRVELLQAISLAVVGCGADVVYPSENRKLAADLAVKGLIISEFPMGAVAFPQNFPIRNRIIAGMSVGVLVVEGAQYSGSAITARLAMEQGREVFAVPGNITSKLSCPAPRKPRG